jgi:signal transduction histidine kinase
MLRKKYRQRLDALFSDIKRLAADPAGDTPAIRRELDELRARLCELEEQFSESAKRTAEPESAPPSEIMEAEGNEEEARPVAPILYEKEHVGYVYTDDGVKSLQALMPALPGAIDTIIAPLKASGQMIGKMQIEPALERPWTKEEASLLNAVAQQASLQIQNLRLLAEAERSRAEAEAATRRFMHENWDSYLDAIHHSERVGYAYDQAAVTPYMEPARAEGGFLESVQVMDEQVGTLYLKPDPARPLTKDDKALVSAIARQIAQQVENLRLLADATRSRAEAEEATRRLTREGWQSYTSQQDQAGLCFVYDSNRVTALGESPLPQEPTFAQPLSVRGETIGQLAVVGWKDISPETADLTAAVAAQASIHIETLRLTEELQKRAAELATVATVSTTASNVLDPDELLDKVVNLTKERFNLYHSHIYLMDKSWNILLLAAGAGEIGRQMVAEGWNIPLNHEQSIVASAARNRQSIIANNIVRDKDSSFLSNRLLADTRSEMAVPMIVGEKLLGVFDVQSDITNYFTEEDANIYTTLASQVAVSLQNARLYAEQTATVTQLRELDKLKSSFLANMSHELRTPLNSILGFSDVILEELDGPLTENMQNDVRLIQKNGQHLLHLINDVLDMAKIESGRMNLHPEKFRVHETLDEVTSITSTLASEKNLSLFIENDSDQDVEIFADRTRIRQVMINLVNNSIKFTEKGKIALCVKHQDEKVIITVKDTGIGIPPDKLEAVFQEFTQVDTSTTRKGGGTGLGLPISRRLVEMHGGRIWGESTGNPGEGSTFFVELPLEARFTEVVEKQER